MTEERWLPVPIPELEHRYQVSDEGRVCRSDLTMVKIGVVSGYSRVSLGDAVTGWKNYRLNRLVLLAFEGTSPPGKPYALHRINDKSNCRLDNLYWGDQHDNMADRLRDGNHHNANRTCCYKGHELLAANVYVTTKGYRQCRECMRSYQREWRRLRKGLVAA